MEHKNCVRFLDDFEFWWKERDRGGDAVVAEVLDRFINLLAVVLVSRHVFCGRDAGFAVIRCLDMFVVIAMLV